MSNTQAQKDADRARRARIATLEREIDELRARLPKHSTPPAMIIALEDLEEELALLRQPPPPSIRPAGGERGGHERT